MTAAAIAKDMVAELSVISPEGVEEVFSLNQWPATMGKARDCTVALSGWKAGRQHARLILKGDDVWIEDLGSMAGTWVSGQRVVRHGPLHFADEIQVAGYRMRLTSQAKPTLNGAARTPTANFGVATQDTSGSRVAELAIPIAANAVVTADSHGASRSEAALASPTTTAPAKTAGRVFGFGKKAPPAPDKTSAETLPSPAPPAQVAPPDQPDVMFVWRQKIHEMLLNTIDLRRRDLVRMSDYELRTETEALIRELVSHHEASIPAEVDRALLLTSVLHEAVGLGPLEELLADPAITEIMVNRFNEVFIEKRGKLIKHGVSFTSDRAVLGIIERIVTPIGRRIDESSPMVDARLKDGSRVNAVIPPLAIKGPTITIRKFSSKKLQTDDLVAYDSVSQSMVDFLRVCVEFRKNIVVSGGTGSGKTTFLNVLSNFIPDGERIVTVEDAAELRLNHSHLVSLEARPSNAEGRGAVAIRDLVKNCLRMRPDRIVVGECRGGEALDMLQAMNTGHEGSLTTLHANTPRDAVARLETMVLMSGMDLPLVAIREQIASAVDIIVQQTRFPCGSRKVTSITEVCGMENGRIQLLELFKFERKGRDDDGRVLGQFANCDAMPTFYEDLREQGAPLDISIFQKANP